MIFAFLMMLAVQGEAETAPSPVSTILFESEETIREVVSSPDTKRLVVKSHGAILALDSSDGETRWQANVPTVSPRGVGGVRPSLLAVSRETVFTGWIYSSTMSEPAVGIYSLKSGELKESIRLATFGSDFVCLDVDPKGKWLWFGLKGGQLLQANVASPEGWSKTELGKSKLIAMSMDPSGKQVALACSDKSIRFVGRSNLSIDKDRVFQPDVGRITAMTFAPRGKDLVVAGYRGKVTVLTAKGKVRQKFRGPISSVDCIALHPSLKWGAFGHENGVIHVVDWKSQAVIAKLRHEGADKGIASLVVCDKGKTLLSAGGKTIRRWDLSELK